jgi:voltage-gated potassium channel
VNGEENARPPEDPPSASDSSVEGGRSWRERVHEVIFGFDTPAGKAFDVALIVFIVLSVIVVILDSLDEVSEQYGTTLLVAEWVFTILFTIEYTLRLACVRRPARYALSFFGIVDVLALLPTYLSLFLPGSQYLVVIRVLRVLRVFRVLKLGHHIRDANLLTRALISSRRKIVVFVYVVLTLVVIVGSLMYLIEGEENGFTSIPVSIYWTIVTLTTVGYGDITPKTPVGQTLAAIVMLLGYAIIAVPTGIVTAEITRASAKEDASSAQDSDRTCVECESGGHEPDAAFCKRCGASL